MTTGYFDQVVEGCVYGAEVCTLGLAAGQISVLAFQVVFFLGTWGHSIAQCHYETNEHSERDMNSFSNTEESSCWIWMECSLGLLSCMITVFIVPVFFFLLGPLKFLPYPDIQAGSGAVEFAGAIINGMCIIVFVAVHVQMAENWAAEACIKREHQLVIKGVFKWARHPMYAAFVWYTVGLYLATSNWIFLLVWCPLVFHKLIIIAKEEKMMLHMFGAQYSEYQGKVPALGFPLCCIYRRVGHREPLLGSV